MMLVQKGDLRVCLKRNSGIRSLGMELSRAQLERRASEHRSQRLSTTPSSHLRSFIILVTVDGTSTWFPLQLLASCRRLDPKLSVQQSSRDGGKLKMQKVLC